MVRIILVATPRTIIPSYLLGIGLGEHGIASAEENTQINKVRGRAEEFAFEA